MRRSRSSAGVLSRGRRSDRGDRLAAGGSEPSRRSQRPAKERDCRWARRRWREPARPGEQQTILTLEEPMAAYPAGGPALGRIVLGTCHFCASQHRCPGSAGELPATVATTASSRGYGPEVDHACAEPSLMPAMPPPERPCGRTVPAGKVQQLSIVGDEDEFGLCGRQFHRTNHPVAGLEANISHASLPSISGLTRFTTPRACQAPGRANRRSRWSGTRLLPALKVTNSLT